MKGSIKQYWKQSGKAIKKDWHSVCRLNDFKDSIASKGLEKMKKSEPDLPYVKVFSKSIVPS